MSQHHEQQQEKSGMKTQARALYQATRCADAVVRSLEQSSNTGRICIAREVPGVQEQEQSANTQQRAVARDEPGVLEQEQSANTQQQAVAREEPGV